MKDKVTITYSANLKPAIKELKILEGCIKRLKKMGIHLVPSDSFMAKALKSSQQ